MLNTIIKDKMISIPEFVELKKTAGLSENDINWELKNYINSLIDIAENMGSTEVDKGLKECLINNDEWLEAHSLLNDLWFQMKSIINDMWFNEELMLPNAEDIFIEKAKATFIKLENIESENLRNFLL